MGFFTQFFPLFIDLHYLIFLNILFGIIFIQTAGFMFASAAVGAAVNLKGLGIAILLFGFRSYVTRCAPYTTMSANLMLREIGIALFLACVGLGAGEGFVHTVLYENGYHWIGYGFLITVLPLLIVGIVARKFYKLNFYTLMGLFAGSMTDPPALAYSNETAGNDMPSVGYATVYPLTMFLRILTAQMLILCVA